MWSYAAVKSPKEGDDRKQRSEGVQEEWKYISGSEQNITDSENVLRNKNAGLVCNI